MKLRVFLSFLGVMGIAQAMDYPKAVVAGDAVHATHSYDAVLLDAAKNGSLSLASIARDKGASIDARDADGRTPLMWAVVHGHYPVVRWLLMQGAARDIKCHGMNAVDMALRAYSREDNESALVLADLLSGEITADDGAKQRLPGEIAVSDCSLRRLMLDPHCRELRSCFVYNPGNKELISKKYLPGAVVHGDVAMVESLLGAGGNANEVINPLGGTVLMSAVELGHKDVVDALLHAGALVNVKMAFTNETPLILAAIRGHDAVVKLLLQAGANAQEKDKGGETALIKAVLKGNMPVVQEFIAVKAPLDAPDAAGNTALMIAVRNGQKEMVHQLLTAGAQMAVKNKHGKTVLAIAQQNKDNDIFAALIRAAQPDEASACVADGIDRSYVSAGDEKGTTPLMYAAEQGLLKEVFKLLTYHVEVNQQDKAGYTALDYALGENKIAIAHILRNNGASIDHIYPDGCTPLMRFARAGVVEKINVALKLGADLRIEDTKNGWTALFYALASGRRKAVQELLLPGEVNRPNSAGVTPLMFAVSKGTTEMIGFLLENGADWRLVDAHGDDALWQALGCDDAQAIVPLLIAAGARVDGVYPDKCTLLTRATAKRDLARVKNLLKLREINSAQKDGNGQTALMIALAVGQGDILQEIIAHRKLQQDCPICLDPLLDEHDTLKIFYILSCCGSLICKGCAERLAKSKCPFRCEGVVLQDVYYEFQPGLREWLKGKLLEARAEAACKAAEKKGAAAAGR